jgi:hypothetical protein
VCSLVSTSRHGCPGYWNASGTAYGGWVEVIGSPRRCALLLAITPLMADGGEVLPLPQAPADNTRFRPNGWWRA